MESKGSCQSQSSGTDSARASYAASRRRFLNTRKIVTPQLAFMEHNRTRAMRLLTSVADRNDDSCEFTSPVKPAPQLFHRSHSLSMMVSGSTCTCGNQIAVNAEWLDQLIKCRAEKEQIEKEWRMLY